MTKKKELNLAEVRRLRAGGATWQEVAVELGWNMNGLRDRCQREGYREDIRPAQGRAVITPEITEADGVTIDWAEVEAALMCGCTVDDVAASFGTNVDYLARRYAAAGLAFDSLETLRVQCLARGRCQLKKSLFDLAQNGDRAALSLVNESLKED